MAGRLAGKTAFITAAAQGMGQAAALAFAREGARVWATDVNAQQLKGLDGKERITTRVLDVTDASAIEKTSKEVGDIEAPGPAEDGGDALVEEDPLDQLRLGDVAAAGDPDQLAPGQLRPHLARLLVRVGDRLLLPRAGVDERHPAVPAEPLVEAVRQGAAWAGEGPGALPLAHAISRSASVTSPSRMWKPRSGSSPSARETIR